MGVSKKYNGESWETFGSGEAVDIAVRSTKVVPEGKEMVSVEEALEHVEDRLDQHDKNIAWLTKYGGGGSGSGGGGGQVTEATGVLYVNSFPTGSEVIMDNNGLEISLMEVPAAITKPWSVTVNIGATLIASSTLSRTSNVMYLSASRVRMALQNHHGLLRINAVYEDDANAVYGSVAWTGDVYESVVNLSTTDGSTTLDNITNTELVYNYSVGYLGDTSSYNYRFTLEMTGGQSPVTYTTDIKVLDTQDHDIRIPFASMFPEGTVFPGNEALIGVYTLNATLASIQNPALNASTISTMTIASENILISTTTMSEDKTVPQQVSIDGNMNIQFTAYVQGMTDFTYQVLLCQDKDVIYSPSTASQFIQIASGNGVFGRQVNASIAVSGKSWAIDDPDGEVVLYIKVTSGNKTGAKHYYVAFVPAESAFLNEDSIVIPSKLFDFEARVEDDGTHSFSFDNQDFTYGSQNYPLTSQMGTINGNDLSAIRTVAGVRSLRLSNGACGHIHSFRFNNQTRGFSDFFSQSSTSGNQFTISICFKADYHADDNRTILFCGTVDTAETIIDETTGDPIPNPNYLGVSTGVSVDVHNVYINKEAVCPLSDNTINMVDLVGERTVREIVIEGETVQQVRYVFKVYLNGVLSAIKEPSNSYMQFGSDIYLGCRQYLSDGATVYANLCDCDIYDIKVYDTALNDFDIVTNYINNLARVSYVYNSQTHTYNLDYTVIDKELKKNFCSRDADNNIDSLLYRNGQYTIDFLLDGTGNNLDEQKLNDYAKALSIPIMLVDVSGASSWTFNNFVQQQSAGQVSLGPALGQRMQYWDPNGNYTRVITVNDTSVELQGTSTLENAVKNINVGIPDGTVFIPKDTWLPEQVYTLKSDVIDSSHSNNAAIGNFINSVLGDASGNTFFPYNPTALANVYSSNYVRNQQPTATLKHTVEGFPVFLIMKFATDVTSTVSVTPLGIYSFNLGRDAFRNLGFKSINKITFGGSESIDPVNLFPFVGTQAVITETDSDANWIEIDGTSEMDISGVTDSLPENFDSSHGDFWQNNDNILNNRYSVRYPSGRTPSSYTNFKNLVTGVMTLPVEGTSTTNVMGVVTRPQIASAYNLYMCSSDGTNYVPTGATQQMSTNYESAASYLDDTMEFESFYKYFVIAMLFGLVDNFGKNSTYRSWGGGKYYMGFYDLDTALQNDNQGKLTIDPDTWFKFIYNKQDGDNEFGYMAETEDSTISETGSAVSARSNKLWLSIDTPTGRQVSSEGAVRTSAYTYWWYQLRSRLQEVAALNHYNDFVDYFVDEFFENQTGECGSLIFNYDYKLKYLLQFTDNSYDKDDDLSRLHGRKVASTREWLKKRIIFLDSVFRWRDVSVEVPGFKTNLFSMGNNDVYNTPSAFPMKTNTSLVMYNQVGTNAQSYYYMKRNKATMVNMASNASNSIVSWNFSNSPNVIEIGDATHPLSSMNINKLGYQPNGAFWDNEGYSAVTGLDLSNTSTLGNTSPLKPFHVEKTETVDGQTVTSKVISELRTIDMSNTSGGQFALNNDLVWSDGTTIKTDFQKLTKLNIRNSRSVTNISIPPVPLQELVVAGSSITEFSLENQAYLTNVNLANCTTLQTIVLRNCARYGDFSISNLSGLTELTIAQCPLMENITVNACGALRKVSIQNNSSLRSITITNCPTLDGYTDSSFSFLTITDCPNLVSINLSNNASLRTFTIQNSNEANITTLNLYGTKVKRFGDQSIFSPIAANTDGCNFTSFTNLTNVNFGGNNEVQYIHFANGESAIPLVNRFNGCTALKRIFGHISVNTNQMFRDCRSFSIHGTNAASISFHNHPVVSSGRWMMPYEVLGVSPDAFTGVGLQTSNLVTNLDFGTTNASYDFYNTSCTTFDVYYVFSNAASVQNFTYTFGYISAPFSWNASVDNSPNRHMLRWATSTTTLAYCFYNSGSGVIRLFSPTRNGDVIGTDGFFSNLTGTLTSIYRMFDGYTIVTDRFLFRHPTSNFTALTDVGYLNIALLHDDANTGTYAQLNPSRNNIKSKFSGTYNNMGNWTDFFSQLTALTHLTHFATSLGYINFSTLAGIPATVTRITASFNSMYASGNLNLGAFVTSRATLQSVMASFTVAYRYQQGDNPEIRAEMPITDSYLTGFTSLISIGNPENSGESWDSNDESGATTIDSCSFMGYGIHKYIAQDTFPYSILTPCMQSIKVFSGFFSGLELGGTGYYNDVPALPGKLFYDSERAQNATNLLRASGLFMNMNMPYTISSHGFVASTGIKDVSSMFAATSTIQIPDNASSTMSASARKNYGQGFIPHELFYHGEGTNKTITYNGIAGTVTEVTGGYKVTPTGGSDYYMKVTGSTITWYSDAEMTVETTSPVQTETVSYRNVNRNIVKINNCFQRGNFSEYESTAHATATDYETNERYQPFDWLLDGTTWSDASNSKNTNPYTDMWEYDGNPDHKTSASGVENLDVTSFTVPVIPHPVPSTTPAGTKHFMCSPDLLRYCADSCNLTYLFAYAGHDNHSPSRGNIFSQRAQDATYGMKGRIVPWFLYPFKNAGSVNLNGMFIDCKMLSSYQQTSSPVYVIPEDLFTWCPNINSLYATFQGMIFPEGFDLDIFGSIPTNKLTDISYVFYRPLFCGTSTIEGIFNKFTGLAKTYAAFAITISAREQGSFTYSQSVTFSSVFKTGTYNTGAYSSNMNFAYTFAGYTAATFGTKTLIDNTTVHNYMTYAGNN